METNAFQMPALSPPDPGRYPLVVELVFAEPLDEDEVRRRLSQALGGGVRFETRAVFDPAGDRFHFAEFAEVDPEGQDHAVFAFARALREAVAAGEANPVLPDSLYGAVAVGGVPETESAFSICETDRDETLPKGWHHAKIGTPKAWARTRGKGSTVAVIDTGHSSHAELGGAIRKTGQTNLVEGGSDASDRFSGGLLTNPGHGTLVCSVIASRGTADGAGATGSPGSITGTAPEAEILSIRAIRSVIRFSQTTIAPAIMHAVAEKADVISMALGGPTRVASTEQALRHATAAGCVIVCAAGNCWPSVVFPAAYAPMGICTAVAALQPDLRPWAKTGRGPEVTLSAFGEHVWGASKNEAGGSDTALRATQGTTLAASMTAGVAALWVARHGGRAALLTKAKAAGTTVQAMWVHCATQGLTKPPVWNGASNLGAGVLDAERILAAALPSGAEAAPRPGEAVEPTLNVLVAHLAGHDAEAAAEVTPALAPYAPELLWLSFRAGARARMVEGGLEAMIRPDRPSPDLEAALAGKPALRAVAGAGD